MMNALQVECDKTVLDKKERERQSILIDSLSTSTERWKGEEEGEDKKSV